MLNTTRLLLYVVFLFCMWEGLSQQASVEGRVSIHNSKYETGQIQYVSDAYITAFQAKPASSDSEGKLQLTFVGLPPGTSVSVAPEKQGLVVVNGYELERVVVNQKDPVRVFLTSREQLAKAQTDLYNISPDALFAKKDALVTRLRKDDEDSKKALAELEAYLGHPIEDRFQAETELISRIQELERQLPQYAQDLARQNLDFTSDQYIEAYEYFKAGEVQKAIDVLNAESLEASYAQIKETRSEAARMDSIRRDLEDKSRLQLQQLINSYLLKAKAYEVSFRYAQAAEQYETVIGLFEDPENDLPPLSLADRYNEAGFFYYQDGKFDKALDYHKKAADLQKKELGDKDPALADSYGSMGNTLIELGRYNEAKEVQQKAVDILTVSREADHPDPASAYDGLGGAYGYLGDFENALKYQLMAIRIGEAKLDSLDEGLGTIYNNIGITYNNLDQNLKALEYQKKVIAINEAILDPLHPDLAISYHNIALTYNDLGEHQKALDFQLKALEMDEKVLNDLHPALARTYNNLAGTYGDLQEFDKALDFQKRSLAIEEKVLDSLHPELAVSYINMGGIYYDMGAYDKSVVYQRKSIRIIEQLEDVDPQELAVACHNLALTLVEMDQTEEALQLQLKALEIDLETLDEMDPDLARTYGNIAGTYDALGETKTAMRYQKKALDIQKDVLEPNDPELLAAYLGMAILHLDLDNSSRARTFRDRLAEIIASGTVEDEDYWQNELSEFDKEFQEKSKN